MCGLSEDQFFDFWPFLLQWLDEKEESDSVRWLVQDVMAAYIRLPSLLDWQYVSQPVAADTTRDPPFSLVHACLHGRKSLGIGLFRLFLDVIKSPVAFGNAMARCVSDESDMGTSQQIQEEVRPINRFGRSSRKHPRDHEDMGLSRLFWSRFSPHHQAVVLSFWRTAFYYVA